MFLSELRRQVRELIGANGLLAAQWPGYEAREGQLAMALEVARALAEDDITVIEAGTGTGKTLAYLLPALLSGRKTIVSTGLKNLQDQIYEKDLPFIRRYLGDGFRAVRLKGRENYLCLYRLKSLTAQKSLLENDQQTLLDAVTDWAVQSATGDRAEITFLAEENPWWAELSSPADRCLGQRCPAFNACFLWRARRQAAGADLVVVNHHLFMADLAVRGRGFGEVIPEWEAAIFDEAHLLEEAATGYFGHHLSTTALNYLKKDLEKILPALSLSAQSDLRPLIHILGNRTAALSGHFYPQAAEFELWGDDDPQAAEFQDFLTAWTADLLLLGGLLNRLTDSHEEIISLAKRTLRSAETLSLIAEATDDNYLYQMERRGHYVDLSAIPIEVAGRLAQELMGNGRPLIFTSATLTAGGSFAHFKSRLGLLDEVEGLAVPSPFDYLNQTLLYLPKDFPQPNEPLYQKSLPEAVEKLINLSRGRALVLFTSHRQLNRVFEYLRPRSPWPLLMQGQRPRARLLDNFAQDVDSVLLATHSFWQGVDVPGESLSAVIIDKLPFPRPDRPLIRARSERLLSQGGDPFLDYHLPETIITLKQGLGRLMRAGRDRGLLAILDSRLIKKSYGKIIRASLGASPLTHDLAQVAAFMNSGPSSGGGA